MATILDQATGLTIDIGDMDPERAATLLRKVRETGQTPSRPISSPGERARTEAAELSPGPPVPPQSLGDIVPREVFSAAGATAGQVAAGAPAVASAVSSGGITAPAVPAAMLAGGALGAAGGSLVFDTVDEALEALGVFPGRDRGPLEPTKEAFREATFEAGATGAVGVAQKVGGMAARGARSIMGVTKPEVQAVMNKANKLGIPLSAVDVTTTGAPRAFVRIASVFPFAGGQVAKREEAVKLGAVDRAANDMLGSIAPWTAFDSLGRDSFEFAEKGFSSVRAGIANRWNSARKIAMNVSDPDIVPTEEISTAAREINRRLEGKRPRLKAKGPSPEETEFIEAMRDAGIDPGTGMGAQRKLRRPTSDDLAGYLKELEDLSEHINYDEWRQIRFDLNEFFRKSGKEGFDTSRLAEIATAHDSALVNLDVTRLPEAEASAVRGAVREASNFTHESLKRFETGTAQKFAQVEKDIFRSPKSFKPGMKTADELATFAFNSKSPTAVKEFADLVGKKNFRGFVRQHIGNAYQDSLKRVERGREAFMQFDVNRFERNLGLSGADKGQKAALEQMLKGTGVTVKGVEDFIQVARTAGEFTAPLTSQFVQRRLSFSIARGAALAAGFGFGISNPVLGASALLMSRHMTRIMTSPERLKLMTKALDPNLSPRQASIVLTRVAQSLGRAESRPSPGERARTQASPETAIPPAQ